MKKFLGVFLACALVFGCIGFIAPTSQVSAAETYEIALITDLGQIDDKSFNQGAWEGVVAYAQANDNISHKYYKPAGDAVSDYENAIKLAVTGGAKYIVTPGFLFEVPVFNLQKSYPNVKFIILDGSPNNGAFDNTRVEEIASNTASIFYAEEQSGYLAGYAAVKDGMTKLGFMGGMAVPAVMRFGHGYIQGANDAAVEMELTKNIEIQYFYTGSFAATPDAQSKATGWYRTGTEVIFACGGAVGQSVMAAASATGKKVIGVDVDQKADSTTVITSATKGLTPSTVQALTAAYAGGDEWKKWGGKSANLDAKVDGVGLPNDFSRFSTFDKAQYDVVFGKLVNGTKVVDKTLFQADNTTEFFPECAKVTLNPVAATTADLWWVWVILGVAVVGGVVAFVIINNKKKQARD